MVPLQKSLVRALLRGTLDRNADRRHDLVGQFLPLGIPKREQVPDVADDAVDEVRKLPDDRQAETDWLPSLLADHLELHYALADARPRRPLLVAVVPDDVGERGQRSQPGDEDTHERIGGRTRPSVAVTATGADVVGRGDGGARPDAGDEE